MKSAETEAFAKAAPTQFAPEIFGRSVGRSKGRVILYHRDIANRCPSCGKQQWFVGRYSATCAFCEDSIPLANPLAEPRT